MTEKTLQDHTLLDALPPGLGLATSAGSGHGHNGIRAPRFGYAGWVGLKNIYSADPSI